MYIARILYPVKVLGPGERIGIWFAGCRHKCPGCSNPELWEFAGKYRTSLEVVMDLIKRVAAEHPIDGFTITGGEPFEQPEELVRLLKQLTCYSEDILIYTGYEYAEVSRRYPAVMELAGALIDGRYLKEQNHGSILRGSDNQQLTIIKEQLRGGYETFLAAPENKIQNFMTTDGMISVGIHQPGFMEQLDRAVKEKGLI